MSSVSSMDTLRRALGELIEAKRNKERECREYLQYAKELLIGDIVTRYEYIETERRGHSGDSDYVISGLVMDKTGIENMKAYIWELKPPQCYLFEKDTKNRLRPTRELLRAENQLFHYHDELKGDDRARHEFGVTHPGYVCLGGIIIGCRRTWVKGINDDGKKKRLYENSLRIRKTYIYDPLGIRLMTWDYILNYLKPPS